jgi:hypothetical protein
MPTARPGFVWSGTEWVAIGPNVPNYNVAVQGTAPASASTGDLWIDTSGTSTGADAYNGAFIETNNTISTNYTINTGRNALTAGPVSIATGAVVTIPDGSAWVIV